MLLSMHTYVDSILLITEPHPQAYFTAKRVVELCVEGGMPASTIQVFFI